MTTTIVEALEAAANRPTASKLPSKAVVAMGETGPGAVLWYVGDDLFNEIDEAGNKTPEDLGLGDAPEGISIWEGVYVWSPGTYEHPYDGDSYPSGKFRAPTDDEWAAIRSGKSPWESEER